MTLPGQVTWTDSAGHQVSNLAFGSNNPNYGGSTITNTASIQAKAKAANIQVMRCPPGTNAVLDQLYASCASSGALMMVILHQNNLTSNQQIVSYLGSRCNLYELGNEPDIGGPNVSGYTSDWNSQIPVLRQLNPNAAFMGPALGIFANYTSYIGTWLQGCQTSGVIPDCVTFHIYPCTGAQSSATCAPKAANFSSAYGKVDALVQSILGHSLPLGLTEWGIDANGAGGGNDSYIVDPNFVGTWFTTAVNNIAQAGYAIACQFDAGSGAGGGDLDLISTSTFTGTALYQPFANAVAGYTPGGTGGGSSLLVGPDTPIGFTVGTKNNSLQPSLVTASSGLGYLDQGVRWLRWQPYANAIELSQGVYTWGNLDTVVSQCNAAGINLCVTVLQPPTWGIQTVGGLTNPTASWTLAFTKALTNRYNGQNGHGVIQAIDMNEDYSGASGMSFNPTAMAAMLNAVYPAIKGQNPNLIFGAPACIPRDHTKFNTWMSTLWGSAAGKFDYINVHPYCQNNSSSDPSVAGGTFYSIPQIISTAESYAASAGHAHFPLWMTEIGWPVNSNGGWPTQYVVDPITQSNYNKYALDQMKSEWSTNGTNVKVFIYQETNTTFGTPTTGIGTCQGMSIYQNGLPQSGWNNPLPAYTMVKNYTKAWGGGTLTTTTQKIRDFAARARVQNGTGTTTLDFAARARVQVVTTTVIDDFMARAYISGAIYDTFVRANQAQWGNSTSGDNWIQAGGTATASILSNQGKLTGATGLNTMRLGVQTLADVEAKVHVTITQAGDIIGLTLRDTGLTKFVRLRLTSTQLQLCQQSTATNFTVLNSYAFTPAGGSVYHLKFRAIGGNLYGKIWLDGTNEPGLWLLSAVTNVTAAGQVGVSATLSVAGDSALFDHFQATTASLAGLPPNSVIVDFAARAGVVAKSTTQSKDFAARAAIADVSVAATTVTTYAAKRKPLERRFPKS